MAFLHLGNTVVITGRRTEALESVTGANHGMRAILLDLERSDSIDSFVAEVRVAYAKLNVLINNAGIRKPEKLLDEDDFTSALSQHRRPFLTPRSAQQPFRPDPAPQLLLAASVQLPVTPATRPQES